MKNKIKNALIILIILQFFFSIKCIAKVKEEDIIKEGEITYITTIEQNITEDELKSKFETDGDIEIEAKGPNGKIGTGSVIRITKGEKIEEYVLIVKGDLNGDSIVDDRDFMKMVRYEAELDMNLEGAYLRAGNIINDDTCIDDKDLLKMARILVGLDNME